MCQVLQRGLRALYCGAYIFVQYKIIWTPETSSEVHARVARRIVDTCKENEGLFVKFGQLLGSMQLALPPEYIPPLSELHDQAKTFDSTTVLRILRDELPQDTLAQLTDLSIDPVASASVAQVHTAYLNGKKVAVKVQKPNIKVQNKWDLLVYYCVLTALEYSFEIPLLWSFDFVSRQLESELDFTVEARNANQCREDFSRHRELAHIACVPETFASSKRVIISEWIESAVKITDVEKLESMGIDAKAAMRDAVRMFAYQIFGSGNVHCDPHPGNLLIRVKPQENESNEEKYCSLTFWKWIKSWAYGESNNTAQHDHEVVLIDHGLYVHLNDTLRSDYIAFWMAMIIDDQGILVEKCKKWGIHDSELFSSMTLMRRRDRKRNRQDNHGYENEEGQNNVNKVMSTEKGKEALDDTEKARLSLERSMKLKERVKNLLNDTSRFPHELGFVNRSVNYIRATNWIHGSPIDRVAIFADAAARATAGDRGHVGEWSIYSPYAVLSMQTHLLARLWIPSIYYSTGLGSVRTCLTGGKNTLWQ